MISYWRKPRKKSKRNDFYGKRWPGLLRPSLIIIQKKGEVIEGFVQESDVGADSWRRTGVYTFSGDQKKTKRVTFSKIQEKSKDHYGRHFSYGTVEHLCVARHQRRLSSKSYKGVANVKYRGLERVSQSDTIPIINGGGQFINFWINFSRMGSTWCYLIEMIRQGSDWTPPTRTRTYQLCQWNQPSPHPLTFWTRTPLSFRFQVTPSLKLQLRLKCVCWNCESIRSAGKEPFSACCPLAKKSRRLKF